MSEISELIDNKNNKPVFVFSKLANSQEYTIYSKPNETGGLSLKLGSVRVNGGAGVVNTKHIQTPKGLCTKITPSDYELLKKCNSFLNHVKNGWVSLSLSDEKPEKVVKDMTSNTDKSAPLTPKSKAVKSLENVDSNARKKK